MVVGWHNNRSPVSHQAGYTHTQKKKNFSKMPERDRFFWWSLTDAFLEDYIRKKMYLYNIYKEDEGIGMSFSTLKLAAFV